MNIDVGSSTPNPGTTSANPRIISANPGTTSPDPGTVRRDPAEVMLVDQMEIDGDVPCVNSTNLGTAYIPALERWNVTH